MPGQDSQKPMPRNLCLAISFCASAAMTHVSLAAEFAWDSEVQQLAHRLEAAERRIQELEADREFPLESPGAIDVAVGRTANGPPPWVGMISSSFPSASQIVERPEQMPEEMPTPQGDPVPAGSQFEAGYENGFYIRSTDAKKVPFDLQINGRMQFQYVGMSSQNPALPNESLFKVNRGRLIFRGHYLDPKLSFYLQTAYETGTASDMIIKDYFVTYGFNKAFRVNLGQWKAPGSRAWLQSSQRLRLADRSMATTFFRPDRTEGIWLDGEPLEDLHYIFMIGNGYKTSRLKPSEMDTGFGYFGTLYWDPLGDFGSGDSDLEWNETPVVRVGSSFSHSKMKPRSTSAEIDFFDLNDTGTPLTTAYPGINGTAAGFNAYLYAADFAMKLRGFSYSVETYFRWLQDFQGAAVPVSSIFDWGFYQEVGYFLIPGRLEMMGRQSRVIHGNGSPSADQYSAGFNWFFEGHPWKFTFEVSHLNGSPVGSDHPNLRVGDRGMLYISQFEMAF
ncbi:hypothetical protein GC176_28410 [bacterium]|nr:hypothetical protein [bacterium]